MAHQQREQGKHHGYMGQAIYRGQASKRKMEDVNPGMLQQQQYTSTGIPKIMSSVVIKLQQEYHARWKALVDAELEADIEAIQQRIHKWSKGKLQAEGVALFGLVADNEGSLFTEALVRVRPKSRPFLPPHRFRPGDIITLCRKSPVEGNVIEGTVAEKAKNSLLLTIAKDEVPNDLKKGTWRLDMGANRVGYDRTMAALDTLASGRVTDGGTILRDLIIGRVTADVTPSWCNTPPRTLPPASVNYESLWAGRPTTATQVDVLKGALGRRLTLIQGPPGTGKTHTAVLLLKTWHAMFPTTNILATADTNTAVDNLLEGLVECGVPCIRIGRPVKVREELRNQTLDGKMAQHPLSSEAQRLRDLLDGSKRARGANGKDEKKPQVNPADIKKQIKDLEFRMTSDILAQTRVVCATCIGAGHDLLSLHRFPLVLIDEATQATEPAVLCPIVKGSEQVVLLGDHFQLPPTVMSDKAAKGGLRRSLFERLTESGVPVQLLDVQYRMHPAISAFPSKEFYKGRVTDGITAADRPSPAGFPWPTNVNSADVPVAFVPVESTESKMSELSHKSKFNRKEAELALGVVEMLQTKGGLSPKQIAIVTPYNGQVKLLTDLAEKRGIGKVTVSTVDGFQGREKDVIIFTAVRANAQGKVGFLSDWKRLNVALTRARFGLVVLGHRPTLEKDEHWANWFKWIDEQKLSVAEDQIPLPQPAPEAAEAPPAYPDIVLDSSSSAPPTPPNEELHPDDVMNNAVDQSAPIVQ